MVNIRNPDGVKIQSTTPKPAWNVEGEKQANCDDNRAFEFEEVH